MARGSLMLKLALLAMAVYAGVAGMVFLAQDGLMFLPQKGFGPPAAPPGWTLERVAVAAKDGTRLAGVLAKPGAGRWPLVIYYGGNAEEVTGAATDAPRFWGRRAALLVNYRGYGESEGEPGEAALVADALELHDWAAKRDDVDAGRIALHGASLGSGVAVQVAAARAVKCVVLSTPFDSARAVAQAIYPWLPVGLLLRHPFDSAARAGAIRVPALVLVAADDTIIPPKHAERLAEAWGGPVERVAFAGRGHNDLFADPAYGAAITRFLDRHLGAPD